MTGAQRDRPHRRWTELLVRLGAEIRRARQAAGLSNAVVSAAARVSPSELSRIEHGTAPWVGLPTLGRIAAIVGLDLWVRCYPGPDPLKDGAHVRLEAAFAARLGPGLEREHEVRIGGERDHRAWDMVIAEPDRRRAGVEFDTRLDDAQAYLRRVSGKRRDSDVDVVILVLLDTRANRAALHAARSMFAAQYEIDGASAWARLAVGGIPDRDVVLFVRLPAHGARLPGG